MKISKWGIFATVIMVLIIALSLLFIGASIHVHICLTKYVSIAQKCFPDEDDKLFSMVRYMNSDQYGLKDRNNMIWAIGQSADKRALNHLLALYTGKPCSHSRYLCQYELSKAINLCGGKVDFKYKDKKYNQ